MKWKLHDHSFERWLRIQVSLGAYAYEMHLHQIMSDQRWDALAKKIRPKMATGNRKLDRFFRQQFDPSTGLWIYKHPDLLGIRNIYTRVWR